MEEMTDQAGKSYWSALIPGTHKVLGPALGPDDPLHPLSNTMKAVQDTGRPCPGWYRELLIEIREAKPYVIRTLRERMGYNSPDIGGSTIASLLQDAEARLMNTFLSQLRALQAHLLPRTCA